MSCLIRAFRIGWPDPAYPSTVTNLYRICFTKLFWLFSSLMTMSTSLLMPSVSNFSDIHYQDMKGTLPHFEKKSFDIQLKCFLRTQNLEEKPPKVICFMSLIWQDIPLLDIRFYYLNLIYFSFSSKIIFNSSCFRSSLNWLLSQVSSLCFFWISLFMSFVTTSFSIKFSKSSLSFTLNIFM